MSRWPMHLSSLSSSFLSSQRTLTHTLEDAADCSIKTHAGMDTAHVLTHPYTNTHAQSGCKCHREEMKAAVVLWFHLVCYIYLTLSGVYCSSLAHTHWLFHQHVDVRCDRNTEEEDQRASYWEHIVRLFFSPLKQTDWLCTNSYLWQEVWKAGGGRFYTFTLTPGSCPVRALSSAVGC